MHAPPVVALLARRAVLAGLLAVVPLTACLPSSQASEPPVPSTPAETPVINHSVRTNDGREVSLADYRGQVLLIVNTASQCGFTPQLGGLQALQAAYGERGFTVLGFPCNDFGGQEPGTNEEIATFCESRFGVQFPIFDKVDIRGNSPHPLYAALQNETAEGIRGAVGWNFTKFLVDTEGRVVARFEPRVRPDAPELVQAIEALLPR
jgi:glutathione peroxidase